MSFEAMSDLEKSRSRETLLLLKQKLKVLNTLIAAKKKEKFSNGAPDEWMGRIQILQNLQLSNELDRHDLSKNIFTK